MEFEETKKGCETMKIALATEGKGGLDDNLSGHFGMSRTFTIVNDDGSVEIVENTSEHYGGTGSPPELLQKKNVDTLICMGMGPRAIDMLAEFKIKVYVGHGGIAKDALEQLKAGKLNPISELDGCKEHHDHHDHHDHHHPHS
jgi:predicted Fe-Mo cluster-binding NifX family protein